jgi:nucleoside 2-deoxyribosyltransferase
MKDKESAIYIAGGQGFDVFGKHALETTIIPAIRKSTGGLIILDGGGLDPDSGTSWEAGFMYALGIPMLGLRTDFRLAGDNDGSSVNLMVEESIKELGATICTNMEYLPRLALSTFGNLREGLPSAR